MAVHSLFVTIVRGRELNVAGLRRSWLKFRCRAGFQARPKSPNCCCFCRDARSTIQWYVKHYLDDVYFPISLCCRSHITVLLGKGFTVCSASASKYDLDLDIPLVHEFRARCILISPVLTVLCVCSLTDPHKSILLLPFQVQNPVNPSDLNW